MTTTLERPPAAPATESVTYWCEWASSNPATAAVHPLGSHAAATPRLAMRWTYSRAQEIAPQLQPPAAWLISGWTRDEREWERALYQLTLGMEYVQTFHEESAHYVLTIRPLAGTAAVDAVNGGGW